MFLLFCATMYLSSIGLFYSCYETGIVSNRHNDIIIIILVYLFKYMHSDVFLRTGYCKFLIYAQHYILILLFLILT
jgi:hypothetical protein